MSLAQKLVPGSATGIVAFTQKLKLAANKDGFSAHHSQIARHLSSLRLTPSILPHKLYQLATLLHLTYPQYSKSLWNRANRIFEPTIPKFSEETQLARDMRSPMVEKTMSRLVTHDTVSRKMSEKTDLIKSWIENSVMSPLAGQSNRVEASTRVKVTYSRQGRKSSIRRSLNLGIIEVRDQEDDVPRLLSSPSLAGK
jgi:hypothetical protein